MEKENKRQKIRKLKNKDFPDYPTFCKDDSREIKPFDYKRYCPPPVMNPMDPKLDLKEIEKQGYLTDQLIDDIINCRKPSKEKQQTKIEYLSTIPVKTIRKMVSLMEESDIPKIIKLKNFITNCLENHSELFISEEEYVEEATTIPTNNEKLEKECLKHFSILESLPYYEDTGEVFYCADIETITDVGYHEPYLICWDKIDGTDKGYSENYGCCKQFIKHLKKQKENKITVLAHNLSYEFAHLLREMDIISSSIEPKNNRVYKAVCYVFVNKQTKKIVFVDTLAKIPMRLDLFKKMFHLEKGKKKDFPYSFYNNNTAFLQNVKMDLDLYEDMAKLFDPEYIVCTRDRKLVVKSRKCALDYCRQDVETLRQGWNRMREMVKEITGIDYNKVVTISALAYAICLKEGCYEGVTECRGKTEAFIRKCVIGGRTMVALHNKKDEGIRILNEEEGEEYQNGFNYDYEDDAIYPEKLENEFGFSRYGKNNVFRKTKTEQEKIKKEVNKDLEQNKKNKFVSPRPRVKKEEYEKYHMYDACSLYPSGSVASNGIPIGFPKRITKEQAKNKSFLKIANEFFIKIKVLHVGKKYNMPMTNYLREDGKRVWSNDIENKIIYVDRVMLEILEKWHEIKYVCKGGLMYMEGYNTKIIDLIKKFYNLRLKYKKEGNPLEIVFKLILNNFYGTNIMREHEERTHWVCGKRVKDPNYMYKIWDKYGMENVEGWEIKRGMLKLKIKNAFDPQHWVCAHWGCIILSESKKIMANAMFPIDKYCHYTDTDSMIISEEGIKIFPKHLLGNKLGQFKLEHHTKSSNMFIEKGIFLAPKLYLLKEVDLDNGNVYWKTASKGIPQSSVEIVCRQKFGGNWLAMYYAMIYRKSKVYFDLLNGGDRIRMDFSSDNKVGTVDEFSRTLGGYM